MGVQQPSPGGRASGGGESISSYRVSLERLLADHKARSAAGVETPAKRVALAEQQRRLNEKMMKLDFAYVQHREVRKIADSRVRGFLGRFSPEMEWEADYAMASYDLPLVSSLIREVVERLRKESRRGRRPRAVGEVLDPVVPAESDVAAAEKLASDAFLQLGRLAEDMTDFSTAERNYQLARTYNADMGVAADAVGAHAALLRALGRKDEAEQVQAEIGELLTR